MEQQAPWIRPVFRFIIYLFEYLHVLQLRTRHTFCQVLRSTLVRCIPVTSLGSGMCSVDRLAETNDSVTNPRSRSSKISSAPRLQFELYPVISAPSSPIPFLLVLMLTVKLPAVCMPVSWAESCFTTWWNKGQIKDNASVHSSKSHPGRKAEESQLTVWASTNGSWI